MPHQHRLVGLAPVGRHNQIGELGAHGLRNRVSEGSLGRRIELHDVAGAIQQDDAIERHIEDRVISGPGIPRIGLRLLPRADLLFERGRPRRGLTQFRSAAAARDHQEGIFEDNPASVLQPAPMAGDQHAVDGLRPEDPAEQVIQDDDDGGRNQHSPIPIEGQKGQ